MRGPVAPMWTIQEQCDAGPVKLISAVEAMLTESATELVRSWRKGRRTLGDLLTDPDEAAFVAGRVGMTPESPIDLADLPTLERVLDAKLRHNNKGWTLPPETIRCAAAVAIRRG
jgi:hypothetical protein